MKNYLYLVSFFACIILSGCKDAKLIIKSKSSVSQANPPGFEINGEQPSTALTGGAMTLKARVEMNPANDSTVTPVLTGGSITLRSGVVR